MRADRRRSEQPAFLWESEAAQLSSIDQLVTCAARLAGPRAKLTPAEQRLVATEGAVAGAVLISLAKQISGGADPLGDAYSRMRTVQARRGAGAIYTPANVVSSMIEWAARKVQEPPASRTTARDRPANPLRVIDPGCGSGRFLTAAAERFPTAELIGIDTDPVATLLLRANAAVRGFARRLTVHVGDYRDLTLPAIPGATLFVGNPPYVRHHEIPERWKDWFSRTAARYGLKASKLAGLHIHFFLKTRELARAGDYGVFITSAEWLDVNYGSVLRALLNDGLHGLAIHILEPQLRPFADAITTGAITCFQMGDDSGPMRIRRIRNIAELCDLADDAGRPVARAVLRTARKWSNIAKTQAGTGPDANTSIDRAASGSDWNTGFRRRRPGFVELGELFRVHRGQVTGANDVWIAGAYPGRLPERVLLPAITRARELFAAGEALNSAEHLRRVIDLPEAFDVLPAAELEWVEAFLAWARRCGAQTGYIARHRQPWWSVRLRAPAPILCTYMARRPPAFVRNLCGARHINIAHGLYPREPLAEGTLRSILRYLRANVGLESGRTYAGGLTKFEPKELERLYIPRVERLYATAATVED